MLEVRARLGASKVAWGLLGLLLRVDVAIAETGVSSRIAVAPASAGQISISNTVVRRTCGDGRAAAKCTWSGSPLEAGRARPEALAALRRVLNFPTLERAHAPPELPLELVRLLVDVSDTFGGAQICVISGYRCFEQNGKRCSRYQKESSRHLTGHAVDITLIGVDNVDLATYVLQLSESEGPFARRLGVGYYPNQEHVHVDVREKPRYWVDTSFGGQPPRYDRAAPPPVQAFFQHYDAQRAPARPGAQCPTLEDAAEGEAELEEAALSAHGGWRNLFVTESPLGSSPSVESVLERKQIDFVLLPELEGVVAP